MTNLPDFRQKSGKRIPEMPLWMVQQAMAAALVAGPQTEEQLDRSLSEVNHLRVCAALFELFLNGGLSLTVQDDEVLFRATTSTDAKRILEAAKREAD